MIIGMFNNYNFKLLPIEFAARFLFQENLLKSQSGYQIKLARWHDFMGYFRTLQKKQHKTSVNRSKLHMCPN
ncbi:hypothetical protein HanXRQr2_Chr04g0187571 [Helianthus annuus]|uniref:Uncharacterized protein n=1 Tax=Helianthus annuus TaxID=4232 RepID=A0A9K3JBP7_HELAN|nr:hypothetical protein HanXRQr2_Chr04g0187571 [Helianthus annuus]